MDTISPRRLLGKHLPVHRSHHITSRHPPHTHHHHNLFPRGLSVEISKVIRQSVGHRQGLGTNIPASTERIIFVPFLPLCADHIPPTTAHLRIPCTKPFHPSSSPSPPCASSSHANHHSSFIIHHSSPSAVPPPTPSAAPVLTAAAPAAPAPPPP